MVGCFQGVLETVHELAGALDGDVKGLDRVVVGGASRRRTEPEAAPSEGTPHDANVLATVANLVSKEDGVARVDESGAAGLQRRRRAFSSVARQPFLWYRFQARKLPQTDLKLEAVEDVLHEDVVAALAIVPVRVEVVFCTHGPEDVVQDLAPNRTDGVDSCVAWI